MAVKLLSSLLGLAVALLGLSSVADAESKTPTFIKKIRADAPLVLHVQLTTITPSKTAVGLCRVAGVVVAVKRGESVKLGTPVVTSVACKTRDGKVSPKSVTCYLATEKLQPGTVLRLYGKKGPMTNNMVGIELSKFYQAQIWSLTPAREFRASGPAVTPTATPDGATSSTKPKT